MKIFTKYLLLSFLFLVFQTGFAHGKEMTLQVKGSDTMVNLGQAWAEEFMKRHPQVYIAVTGGGSGTGIAALISGTCDIAEASRTIKSKEIQMAQANGIEPEEFITALDGIAIVVNPENRLNQLTISELADIFTGRIKNWKELGGENLEIVLLSREVTSGTHVFFREHVIKKGDKNNPDEFSPSALLMPSSQAIAEEIALNPNAIGYYGMGYTGDRQKTLAIAKDKSSTYYEPTIENVMQGYYYISRPLLIYTKGKPQGLVKDFMDFIFSDDGQRIVRELDFVPIK
ncbi:MAG: PstS family phosphate ABC transporter substrate-binding protein [Candidatus Omnitrophica bacterium]|nr:PstS family phosphate ABC transporter substrate-binding protein [Candidatus Omnitrophota bacterium]MBU1997817.1 PstS family phosphate ABC transporter substrate-binding protein [Candidatus Omnitrophota bacterium]MBU4333621.1 PstS family phosphate ABC transporter substrate-binding protein [Candidatus Omnitrophota bacterium]